MKSNMIYCLCASIVFIVIIIHLSLTKFGKYIDNEESTILTTQHLRGMYVGGIINDRYEKIRHGIIASAFIGNTNFDFTIMCNRAENTICDNYDGYQVWWNRYISRNGGEFIPKNDIRSEQIKTHIIEKIQYAFPDSSITKNYKNCCDTYNISW